MRFFVVQIREINFLFKTTEQLHKQHQGMPSRVKKPRSEQRRSSGVGSSPASAKSTKTTVSVPIPATSPILPTPIAQQCSVPEIQIPPPTPVPATVPVTVLKSTPVKLNNSSLVTVRQEIRYYQLVLGGFYYCFP
jgi:hypothetical protein